MSPPAWLIEIADTFWDQAGDREEFPRSLHTAIAFGLPITTVSLPRLTVSSMNMWLAKNDIENIWYQQDRRLRACLVAHSGHGIIFLDSTDSDEEQRFSLAHELAHYLLDYWKPRKNAVQRLGSTVLEVFDGVRPPWPEERIDAILTGIQLGFHVHLMERNSEGRIAVAAISTAESRADRLAYELLAPSDKVFESLEHCGTNEPREAACALLQTDFGLPEIQAMLYALLLLPDVKPPNNFLLRLGL